MIPKRVCLIWVALVALIFLGVALARAEAGTFTLFVETQNRPDVSINAPCSKAGDILGVLPGLVPGGTEERKQCTIVHVSGLTDKEVQELMAEYRPGGLKRRYQVDLATVKATLAPTMDLAAIADARIVYQPIEKLVIPVGFFAIFLDKVAGKLINRPTIPAIEELGKEI